MAPGEDRALWSVMLPKKVHKSQSSLPKTQQEIFMALLRDLRRSGPVQGSWPNYSKLGASKHHCHLSHKWVVCWEVVDKQIRIIEVYYVGSRKDAPY